MSNEIRISIVVPTFQRPHSLQRCLSSIAATVRSKHEVIVVAVAGDVETIGVAQQAADEGSREGGVGEVRTLTQERREGFVKAANLGFRSARGTFVLQINDDCELLPHSVENAMRFMEAAAHGAVGMAAFFHDSPVTRNIHAQIQLDGRWFYVCHVRGLCYANYGVVRREVGEQLGWFDERYFMYGADPDFSLKIWHDAKLRVEPCPGALIHHAELNDDRGTSERARQGEDNARLFAKWGLD